jgi:hypothetical protein
MSEPEDGQTIAEPTRASIRSRRPAGTEIASGCGERTHKDKAFIFIQIGHLDQERTNSEYRLCYQLLAAIFSMILANFKWTGSSDCRLPAIEGAGRKPSDATRS